MSASDTARPERSGRFFPARPSVPGQNQHELSKGRAEAVEFPRLCCKSLFVHLRSPHMTKRDPVVADIAPSADTLTAYDNYPFSQHVSCIVGRVQQLSHFTCLQSAGMRQIPVSSWAMMATVVHRVVAS